LYDHARRSSINVVRPLIDVQSRAEARSTLEVRLRARRDAEFHAIIADLIMNKDAARLVLVVEDDVSVRRPLVKFLEMHGFAVVTAETSDEGLDALRKHRLTAAVVDLRLRRGSGRDVVVSTPSDVPVIIFSGVPSESAELERIRPRTRLIEKPYSLVLLVETLEEMLGESQNLPS